MKVPIKINLQNGDKYFYLEQLTLVAGIVNFSCSIPEYNDYLFNEAHRSQKDHVALTWLLRERNSNTVISYMSVIADAIKLSATEKELHNLNYPFKTLPAIKIAKLAVSQSAYEKYRGIGTYMVFAALNIARTCNSDLFAARFLTVDADIEHVTVT
ncbi:MAG: hypothetical protein FWD40_12315 [Treponema sp.]|nr:hypothetical protein [Treponema sp.]